MVTKRKFNTELTEEDIFYFKEEDIKNFNLEELTWDWHFEKSAYYVKKDTIEKFGDMINIAVKNRGIVEHVYFVFTIDLPNIGVRLDINLLHFYQSLYSRMIKTSKVIQDLAIQGSYIEAKSLLRGNFERAILIAYFTKHLTEIEEFLEAKAKNDRKILNQKYSVKNMLKNIKRHDYKTYKILCCYAHPDFYSEDLMEFEFNGGLWASMQAYNSLDEKDFQGIMLWNNNLLLESFDTMMTYLLDNCPKEKIDESLQKVLDETKGLKMIITKESKKRKLTRDS